MRPSSRAPMTPRVLELSTRWMVTTSARAIRSSFDTRVAPSSSARSRVRFWLHASRDMPKARPMAATWDPRRPSPTRPSTLPFRPVPMVTCQLPWRVARSSVGIPRARESISPQVNSAVGYPRPRVPQTVIPRPAAAPTSMEALRMPVVTRSLRSGRASSRSRRKGVRSLMATTMSKPERRRATSVGPGRWSPKAVTETSRAREPQAAMLRATFW